MPKPKIPRIAKRMRDEGLVLCVERFCDMADRYWVTYPNGHTRVVTHDGALAAISHPAVRPGDDGLFPGESQTYRWDPEWRAS